MLYHLSEKDPCCELIYAQGDGFGLGTGQNLWEYGVGQMDFSHLQKSHDPVVLRVKKSHDPVVFGVKKSPDPVVLGVKKSHDPVVLGVNKSHDPVFPRKSCIFVYGIFSQKY